MSTSGTPRSGKGPEDMADVTSGYNTGGEEDKSGVGSAARERRRKEEAAREKLKEELLRQFEAGQLKAKQDDESQTSPSAQEIQKLLRDYKVVDGGRDFKVMDGGTQPRQIPTIEEQRDKTASTRRSSIPASRQAVPAPTVPLPDLSRPPPGYLRPVQTMPLSFYQPQPLYNYEDTIVTRVLQSLMGSRAQQQVELPSVQPQDVFDKVISWDMETEGGRKDAARRSLGRMEKSLSRERRHTRSRERSGERSRPKRRSLSIETVCRPEVRSSSRRKSSRSRSRHEEKKRMVKSTRRERARSVERLLRKSNRHHSHSSSRREVSPLTRTCSLRTEKTSQGKRKHESHSVGNSPRIRKIVLLSPMRAKKSVREVIMDERDHTRLKDEYHERERSPEKKRVKDRLGVRKEDPEKMEVYNMDTNLGRCGAVAIVKEFIDSKTGIMELRTSEGGRGAVILFSAEQVWIPDRKRDPNGPPKSYVASTSSISLQTLFPVGQEVLMNARKVESPLVDLQATAVWPKFTEIPEYKIRPKMLDDVLGYFHEDCKVDKLVPICINGLAPVGSLNIWSARVRQIVDEEWGVLEIKSVPRDGKREFSFRFFCFFHKSDVWMEEGICVGEHKHFKDKPLGEIVQLLQPVDVVARSIIREKGLAMKKAVGSSVEMQALCVSLKPDCIPDGASRGTRVDGGPGAFGGSNRGETPYMFKKGLDHILNVKLAKYLQASGKVCHNLDPSLVVKLEESKTLKKDDEPKKMVHNETEKKVHKLTKNVETSKKPVAGTVAVDSQNNVVEAIHARPPVKLYEKLSNSTARVREYISESVGLLENLTRDWLCLFQISDCVLTQGIKPLQLYPVGTKVQLNANLVDASQQVQYIASCVWRKSENAMILPNNVEKSMISASKSALFNELNLKLSHIDLKTGLVVKILDDNFGVIKQGSRMILFDTCDFWTSQKATAAQSNESLPSLVSVGDTVMLHAALIQSSSMIPYLATAVWLANLSPFPPDKCPVAIRRGNIHPDKIKIYEMVSRCSALLEELPEVQTIDEEILVPPGTCKTKVYDQKGLVKLAFKLKGSSGLSAAIVEFTKSKDGKHFAFYLASSSVESHEKTKVCIPDTKVYFSAIPLVGEAEDFPVSHIATAVSHIHNKMPISDDTDRIVEAAREALSKIREQKVPELADLRSVKSQIISLDVSNKSKAKDPNVIDCFPTGRLVCMFDENSGIMEDHRRELAYFEKGDLNLPSQLEMKDIVMVMTRCRDVTIRFQATHALDGPVKMIVHDGTVAVSSNLERYFPEVEVKKTKISMKQNSFNPEKVSRAKAAVELYKVDKILTPDYIIDSGEFKSTLVKPRRFSSSSSSSISSSIKPIKPAAVSKPEDVKCLVKQTGKVMTILNDSFCLLKFCQPNTSPSYCLFDTFDLYLEGGRTAAQSKLTVANVLDLDMEVCFHACEISPGSSVPWLATGVWRPEKASQPKPVAYGKITKEKISVFKKVAETCSVLVSGDLVSKSKQSAEVEIVEIEKNTVECEEGSDMTIDLNMVKETESNINSDDGKEVSTSKQLNERTGDVLQGMIENGPVMMKEAVIEGDVGDKIDNNIHTNCDDENLDRSPGDVAAEKNVFLELNNSGLLVKEELEECKQDFLKSKAGVERPCADVFVKEEVTDTIDDQIKTSVDDDTADGVIGDPNNHGYQESMLKESTTHEEIKKQSPGNAPLLSLPLLSLPLLSLPLLSLPKFLADQTTTGTLNQQLSAQFAIITLDFPAGTKALLHCDRLWLADQAMSVWDGLTEQVVRVNARRVDGFEEFDYQVTFAHLDNGVGQNEEGGLVKFSEDKLEAHTLDKELEMFKKN